jgi:hypothetical protein
MVHTLVSKKKAPCMHVRTAALSRNAARDERLSCAVLELRQSIWDEIWHIARCWKVDPRELVEASRGGS